MTSGAVSCLYQYPLYKIRNECCWINGKQNVIWTPNPTVFTLNRDKIPLGMVAVMPAEAGRFHEFHDKLGYWATCCLKIPKLQNNEIVIHAKINMDLKNSMPNEKNICCTIPPHRGTWKPHIQRDRTIVFTRSSGRKLGSYCSVSRVLIKHNKNSWGYKVMMVATSKYLMSEKQNNELNTVPKRWRTNDQ